MERLSYTEWRKIMLSEDGEFAHIPESVKWEMYEERERLRGEENEEVCADLFRVSGWIGDTCFVCMVEPFN